ncbi:MAG TPA: translocation/assembly module TamB, partial [Sphingomonas sp.]
MRRAWARWLLGALTLLLAIFGVALIVVDTSIGHRFVADRVAAIRTPTGLRFTVGRIDGSLYHETRLVDVRVYDLDGLLLQAPAVALDWAPLRWFRNELAIERLAIPRATLFHAPRTRKTQKQGPILPDFDIRLDAVSIDRLVLAKPVIGTARVARLAGRADIRAGRALVDLTALVAGSDELRVAIDSAPDRDRFDIDVRARGAAGGVLARSIGFGRAVTLDVAGDGRWAQWRGRAVARIA